MCPLLQGRSRCMSSRVCVDGAMRLPRRRVDDSNVSLAGCHRRCAVVRFVSRREIATWALVLGVTMPVSRAHLEATTRIPHHDGASPVARQS